MCSRSHGRKVPPTILVVLVSAALLLNTSAGAQSDAGPAPVPDATYASGLIPGGGTMPAPDPVGKRFNGDAQSIASGMVLFGQMNCLGCHSHGGGGMGISLRSGYWHYGGRIEQLYSSIAQGRPNGMPAWQGLLSTDMIWQLSAYVKTLPAAAPFSLDAPPDAGPAP